MQLFYIFALLGQLSTQAEQHVVVPDRAPTHAYILLDASTYTGTLTWYVPDKSVSIFRSEDGKQALVYSPAAKLVRVRFMSINGPNKTVENLCICFDNISPPPSPAPVPAPERNSYVIQVITKLKEVKSQPGDYALIKQALMSIASDATKIDLANQDVVSDTITRHFLTLPKQVQQTWLPVFGSWWTKIVAERYDAGTLSTPAQWKTFIDLTLEGFNQ